MQERDLIQFKPDQLKLVQDVFTSPLWWTLTLVPAELALIHPEYSRFHELHSLPLIYQREDALQYQSMSKGIVALMGPAAVGKDAILKEVLQKIGNQVEFLKTAVTRERRSNEGQDQQQFMKSEEFKVILSGGGFIEHIERDYGRKTFYYGTPMSAVEAGLQSKKPLVIWRGELEGSQKLKQWLQTYHSEIPFISIFIVPEISFQELFKRIYKERGKETSTRIKKAVWEFKVAPQLSDYLLLNPQEENGTPIRAAAAAVKLFRSWL